MSGKKLLSTFTSFLLLAGLAWDQSFAQHRGTPCQRVCCAIALEDRARCDKDLRVCDDAVSAATVAAGINCARFVHPGAITACAVTVGAGSFAGFQVCDKNHRNCRDAANEKNNHCMNRCRIISGAY